MIPLTMVSPNENMLIINIRGGNRSRKRLADLGLYQGISIQVLNSQMQGPLIVLVKNSRLVLGRGMAQKIMVEPAIDKS
ncbi:MAG: ferrous iron transport protein A [Anaerolineaceae bacterium]|nr:ferrous iron transport protein A [Anaerolineaceae bacterium]